MTFKRMLSAAVAAAMAAGTMGALGITAFAATTVTTESALREAVAKGGEITLGENIELHGSELQIPSGKDVVLDLNGKSVEINDTYSLYEYYNDNGEWIGFKSDKGDTFTPNEDGYADGYGEYWSGMDYYFDGTYSYGYNAIRNYGKLTITGSGTIKSSRNGISNNEDAELYIESSGVTINGNTNGIWNGGTLTVTDGTIFGNDNGVYNEVGNIADIKGGKLQGYYGLYNEADVTKISGGVFEGDNCDIYSTSELDLTNATFDSLAGFKMTKGAYTGITKLDNINIPAASTANISFSNATLSNCKIYGGTFDGSVSAITGKGVLQGGLFSTYLKETFDVNGLKPSVGYGFEMQQDGTYKIISMGNRTVAVQSSNTEYGTIGSISIDYNGNAQSGSGSKSITVGYGSAIKITATATPKSNYTFVGWFTNAAGTGAPLSTDAAINNYAFTLTENTTIYAVFQSSSEYEAFKTAANAWVGTYDSTTSYSINNSDEMEYFKYATNTLKYDFSGKTVSLETNLDYNNADFVPISYAKAFAGTFDGKNHTISNASLTSETGVKETCSGIFGFTSNATIKNLNINNIVIGGTQYGGGLIGYATGGVIDNVKATNISAGIVHSAGGLIGEAGKVTVKNTSVSGVTLPYGRNGGICGIGSNMTITDVSLSNISAGAAATGEVHGSKNTYSNITSNTPGVPFIGTNGDTTPSAGVAALTLTGDNDITASQLMNSCNSGCTCTVESGTYTVDEIVALVGATADIEVKHGVTTSTEIPEEYIEEGYELVKNQDGTYGLEEKAEEVTIDIVTSKAIAEKVNDEGATGFITTITPSGSTTITDIIWEITTDEELDNDRIYLSDYGFKAITGSSEIVWALIMNGLYDPDATATVTVQ